MNMLILKYSILTIVLFLSSYLGLIISQKYQNRVKELKSMKLSLNFFLTKIKLTYQPIPQIFEEIGNNKKSNINKLFKIASEQMNNLSAGEAWTYALENRKCQLK